MSNSKAKGVNAPFLHYAPKYWDLGLPVFPTGGSDGKKPLITRWSKLKEAPSKRSQTAWLGQFPNANLGLVTGKASNITVVDIDDDYAIDFAQEEFGEAECIATTPRGGKHLYYRYNGENKVIGYQGRKLDILGDASFVMLAPSHNPKLNKGYQFLDGDLLYCPTLNILKPEVLLNSDLGTFILPEEASKGKRNKTLYNALRMAFFNGYNTHPKLLDYALQINMEMMKPPLNDKEVIRTVNSVWKYHIQGKLVPPHIQYATLWEEQLERLSPPAVKLYFIAKKNHAGVRDNFKLEQNEMAKKVGVSPETLRKAIKELIAEQLIVQIHTGGSKKGDAHIYTFLRV